MSQVLVLVLASLVLVLVLVLVGLVLVLVLVLVLACPVLVNITGFAAARYPSFRPSAGYTDNLHDYLRFSYPRMVAPSFFCQSETANGLLLRYRSRRRGFVPYVVGQIREVARLYYDTPLTVQVVSTDTVNVGGGETETENNSENSELYVFVHGCCRVYGPASVGWGRGECDWPQKKCETEILLKMFKIVTPFRGSCDFLAQPASENTRLLLNGRVAGGRWAASKILRGDARSPKLAVK